MPERCASMRSMAKCVLPVLVGQGPRLGVPAGAKNRRFGRNSAAADCASTQLNSRKRSDILYMEEGAA